VLGRNGQSHRAAAFDQRGRIAASNAGSNGAVIARIPIVGFEQGRQELPIVGANDIEGNGITQRIVQATPPAGRHSTRNSHIGEHGSLAQEGRAIQQANGRRARHYRQTLDRCVGTVSEGNQHGRRSGSVLELIADLAPEQLAHLVVRQRRQVRDALRHPRGAQPIPNVRP
jgi:hypothetical protein